MRKKRKGSLLRLTLYQFNSKRKNENSIWNESFYF